MTWAWLSSLSVLVSVTAAAVLASRRKSRIIGKLEHLAYIDSLTGLENRPRLIERVEGLLESAKTGTGLTDDAILAFLYLDLDGFKEVNDSFGHAAGDTVLVEATARLRAAVGPAAVVARLGGDEFAVVLAGPHAGPSSVDAAARVLKQLSQPYSIEDTDVIITVSIGVALSTPEVGAEELVRNADLAMYAAKARGKATWAHYEPPMRAGVSSTFAMEAELRRALSESTSELEVAYQPMLDIDSNTFVGAEALARWSTSSAGAVGPSQFVPIAERTGLILELGRQILTRACAAGVEWNDGAQEHSVWVNVSRSQVIMPGFRDEVAAVLEATGLDPARLNLEVSESAWRDLEALIAPLTALRDLGVGLAIDDFGAGVSSLSCLWLVPVTAVKIDQGLIAGIGRVASHEAITESIVRLGSTLGMTVAAEGVETAEQLDFLRSVDCQLAQGYLVAAPMGRAQITTLLRDAGGNDALGLAHGKTDCS